MSSDRYDLLLKIIIVGDTNTGKSCLLHRFIHHRFMEESAHTIGVEFGSKILDHYGKSLKLQVWDTAGQERYRSVTRSYYRGAVGCLLVYDVTKRETFENVKRWLEDVRVLAGKETVVMVVGNKKDLADEGRREVTHVEASFLAQQEGVMLFETSAKNGEYVEEAFIKVARSAAKKMVEAREEGHEEPADSVAIGSSTRPSGKKCSC
eukprot:Sspe_Gene.111460::Locus_93545_Transcript_1_1_Confidence_1.000_Length_810::g.111460::m.111460